MPCKSQTHVHIHSNRVNVTTTININAITIAEADAYVCLLAQIFAYRIKIPRVVLFLNAALVEFAYFRKFRSANLELTVKSAKICIFRTVQLPFAVIFIRFS